MITLRTRFVEERRLAADHPGVLVHVPGMEVAGVPLLRVPRVQNRETRRETRLIFLLFIVS